MAKNSITDYSKTAASNTDIQSVDIDEGCLPSGINNAIRELMADLADMNDGTVTLTSPAFTSVDINGGTIDGTVIGGASAAAGTFTTGQFNTSLNVDGTVTADGGAFTGNVTFGDNDKAIFGAGTDLEIYHDGTDSYISELTPTGSLFIDGSNIFLRSSGGEEFLKAVANAQVELYYNDAIKLATTASGIDVTGTVTADGLTVDGASDLNGNVTIGSSITTLLTGNDIEFQRAGNSYLSQTGGGALSIRTNDGVSNKVRMNLASNGDISFYEDTGTTAKLFWDASAERLGLGTSSPVIPIQLNNYGGLDGNDNQLIISNNTYYSSGDKAVKSGFSTRIDLTNQDGSIRFLNTSASSSADAAITLRERARLDSSGNLLVSKSTANTSTVGVEARENGLLVATRDGGQPLLLDRLTDNGDLILFRKDSATVGSIGSQSGTHINIDSGGDRSGLRFEDNGLLPRKNAAMADGTVTLGNSSYRFKDLYLSGTAHTGLNIHLQDSGITRGKIELNASDADDLDIKAVSLSSNMKFFTVDTEVARLDSSGNLLVGGTSQLGKLTLHNGSTDGLYVNGTGTGYIYRTTNSTGLAGYFVTSAGAAGSISISGTTTSYNTSSDQRLKENIADADDAGRKIDAIQVRQFDWKADGSHQDYGMIAQELQAVAPEAVSGNADSEEMMGVDYSKLVPMLIKEIQSLRNRVSELEGN